MELERQWEALELLELPLALRGHQREGCSCIAPAAPEVPGGIGGPWGT